LRLLSSKRAQAASLTLWAACCGSGGPANALRWIFPRIPCSHPSQRLWIQTAKRWAGVCWACFADSVDAGKTFMRDFLQTFNSLPNLDVVKCFVQQKSANGATYVIRVAQWSNTTFLNNLHLHDGEPDLLDLACDVCVVRVLQTACLVLCHGERGVSQVVCDSNRDTHVCCASVRQERFGNRHVWWCDCWEFHTPSQSFRVSGRS
jgi:hypothetical protein